MEEPEQAVRELPRPTRGKRNRPATHTRPSPTTSPGPDQSKASGIPRWLLVDRIVHRSSRRRSGVVEGDATASALAHDCAGRPVRASLRIARPPAVSRLYLHWQGRPAIDFAEPAAVAAHGGCILFRMRVPFEDPLWWSSDCCFPVDYFVYSATSASANAKPPTLTLLPPCFHGGYTNPDSDRYFQPYRNQQQRTMLDKEIGILCHGEPGEFTVADLTQRFHRKLANKVIRGVDLCLLHHPPPGTRIPIQWMVKRLQIPPDMKINLSSFRNDVVVPVGGRHLCWVDYYQGMLLIDVLADSKSQPHQLHFIPLPCQALKHRRPYRDAGVPDPFRSVCVTSDGTIKLVCIFTNQPPAADPFTITSWVLHNVHQGGEWRKVVNNIMGARDFFGLYGPDQSCLPLVQPSFPVVSLVDADVLCFLLKDEDRSLFWIVEVDMRNKKLLSSALYVNEEEEEGYPPKRGCRNSFFGHNFICSNFSSFLSEDAITSWELSEKMQEAKKERVMQKVRLEAKPK